MKGKIILIPFPFTDLTRAKLRPALVLHEGPRDIVVAFISSRLQAATGKGCVIVDESHPEFNLSGLKVASVIRLDKVATVLKDMVVGELGEAGKALRKDINEELRVVYSL